MVKNRYHLWNLIVSSVLCSIAFGDSPIRSVRLASDTTVRIKPCEPVWVLLDVTVDSAYSQTITHVPRQLERAVEIHDRGTGGRLYDSAQDPLAVFFVNASSVKNVSDKVKSFQAVVLLYWNVQNESYLFNAPGLYEVQFAPAVHVEVIVERPGKEEQELLEQMQSIGLEYAMFVMNADDHRARTFITQADKMLQKYRDTVYAKYLSISLGIAKLPLMRREAYRKGNFDAKNFASESVAFARKYFEPHCQGVIKSPYEAAAAYYLGQQVLNEARCEPEGEESAARLREARTFLENAKASPYSLDYGVKAAAMLQELDK